MTPTQINSLSNIVEIYAGGNQSYVKKNDLTIWAFGANNNGQLGNGANTDSNIPVNVNGLCQLTNSTNEKEIELLDINVYPNPTNAKFTVELKSGIKSTTKIEIDNILGETIYFASNINTQTSNEIDISSFQTGLYFVKVYSDNSIYTRRIIKQ